MSGIWSIFAFPKGVILWYYSCGELAPTLLLNNSCCEGALLTQKIAQQIFIAQKWDIFLLQNPLSLLLVIFLKANIWFATICHYFHTCLRILTLQDILFQIRLMFQPETSPKKIYAFWKCKSNICNALHVGNWDFGKFLH